jgi:hypothetical protein
LDLFAEDHRLSRLRNIVAVNVWRGCGGYYICIIGIWVAANRATSKIEEYRLLGFDTAWL